MTKYFHRIVMLGLLAALAGGCASTKQVELREELLAAKAGDEVPPDFLAGPVSALLTKSGGFSAHAVETVSLPNGTGRTLTGELLERDGWMIFQQSVPVKGKHAAAMSGALFFIWDTGGDKGYVLSEALQGFAQAASSVKATNFDVDAKNAVAEEVNGRACHRVEAVAALSDGSSQRFTEWQADEGGHLPIRLRWLMAGKQTTLDFSDVRLEEPRQELFAPPEGFTRYDSPVALMNELMVRQATLRKAAVAASASYVPPQDLQPGMIHAPTFQ
jgi:hypothetical protein